MAGDATNTVITAGAGAMLVSLFTLFMRAVLATGKRSDDRSDAELIREQARSEADSIRLQRELDTMTTDRDYWRGIVIGKIVPPPEKPPDG
jgi:hypothetical protein